VVKNKVAPPFKLAEFDIEYGAGISQEGCLLDLALEHDLAQKSGSFFSYGDLRLGQGRNNSKEYLRQNPEVANEIEKKIYAKLKSEEPAEPEPKVVRAVAAVADPPAEKPEAKPVAKPEAEAKPEPKSAAKPKPAAAKKAA
jgi:recombination protein RecA